MPAAIPFIPLIAAGVSTAGGLYSGYKSNQQNQQVQAGMAATQAQQQENMRLGMERQNGLMDQAQSLIPGMQGISGQYGQAAQGFMGDRERLGQVNAQYGGLMGQMQDLYGRGQNVTGEASGMLRSLFGNAGNVGTITDGGAAASLRNNAQGVLSATDPGVYQAQARLAGNDAMGQISSQLAARGIAGSGATSRLGASTLSRLYGDAAARGQQDKLNAYGISNNALGSAGNMSIAQSQGQAQLGLQGSAQQAQIAQMLGQMGLAGNAQQAGLLGQMGSLIGQQGQGIMGESGLLGNYMQGLQGQYGMQQGIANMYNQQAGMVGNMYGQNQNALGGMYNQQAGQINPNPYAGFTAGLGAVGSAAAAYGKQYGVPAVPAAGGAIPGMGVGNSNPYGPRYAPAVEYSAQGYGVNPSGGGPLLTDSYNPYSARYSRAVMPGGGTYLH